MKNTAKKIIRAGLAMALSLAIGVAFMPMNASGVYAASFMTGNAVSGLTVTATDSGSVSLKWNAYSGASGYQLYRTPKKDGEFKYAITVGSTGCTRSGLPAGRSYYYKVRAYHKDSNGNVTYSRFSPVVTGTTKKFKGASRVSGLAVSRTDSGSVSLKWNAYTGATGYQLYRTPKKGGKFKYAMTVKSTSCTRSGLPAGRSYYYKVRAYNKDSNGKMRYSKFSPVITGTTKAFRVTSRVSGLTVSATDATSVSLKWNEYKGATGYQLYRTPKPDGEFKYAMTVKSTSCKRSKLASGHSYYYKVRAYNKDSKGKVRYSEFSPVITGTTKVFNTANRVSGLYVSSYSGSSVTLKWNSYDLAKGYVIYKASSKNGTYKKIKTLTGSSAKITGLKSKKKGYFKVRAYVKLWNGRYSYSKYSPVVSATPIKFTEDRTDNFRMHARSYDSVTLQWNKYPDADGYQVFRAPKKNGKYKLLTNVKGTTLKRTNLTTNSRSFYKVRAYRIKGQKKVYTKFTSAVEATPRLKRPDTTITSSSKSIKVRWSAVAGASGYEVYRAPSKDGSYSKLKTTSGRSINNTKVTKNHTYYYKVRAYRTIDGKKRYSSFSGIESGVRTSIGKVGRVKAKSKSTCVGLTWKEVSGASGYEVFRATGSSSDYTKVGRATSSAFDDYNVAHGLTYYYKVRAYRNINGARVYGSFSSVGYSRSAVVSTAVAWLGCKESNRTNKPIVDLYNSNMGTRFSYTTPWCAIFVSAVAIKSGTTPIIVRGSYCPAVISVYKNSKTDNYKYGAGSSYVPKAGDVIFFDWNRNGVPDHTGLVASVSGKTIKTIEGNYSDAVGYRTFSVGYRYVQGYGLPNYNDANGILYTGKSNVSVGCGELAARGIGIEPEGLEELGSEYDFVEQNVDENIGEAEDVSDYDKMVYMVSKVRASAETEGIDCAETQYYAAFIYKLCEEEGFDASIMTVEDEDGVTHAWVEVALDDKWYTVDASKETDQIIEFMPESTDVEGVVAEPTEEEMSDAEDADEADVEAEDEEGADVEDADAEAADAETEAPEAEDTAE